MQSLPTYHQFSNNWRPHHIQKRIVYDPAHCSPLYEGLGNIAPESANICSEFLSEWAYPLHLACANTNCPNLVVQLLAKINPTALRHLCVLEDRIYTEDYDVVDGLPLHYYFSRESNIDLDTVKVLIDLNTDSLTALASGEDTKCVSIHVLLDHNEVGKFSDIIKYIIGVNSSCLQCTDQFDQVALHVACYNEHISVNIIQMLVDGWQESTRSTDNNGWLPIHHLCQNNYLDDAVKLKALKILISANPESLHASTTDLQRSLPIHIASRFQGPAFCEILAEHSPDTLWARGMDGSLPLHEACQLGSPDTVKYLIEMHPKAISISNDCGYYPLHMALMMRSSEEQLQFELVKFLLRCDPDIGSKPSLFLHFACETKAALGTVQLLFDAHPKAIYKLTGDLGKGPILIARELGYDEAADFLEEQSNNLFSLVDSVPNLSFPIHHALRANFTLGVIKLFSDSFPGQYQVADDEGLIPLHIACEAGRNDVVEYFLESDKTSISALDGDRNSPLHLACRGGKCDVVNYLLEVNSPSVSEQNGDNKLPIELLLEAGCEEDSVEYTEAIWRLIVAYPESLLA